jgi:hypothetical protein
MGISDNQKIILLIISTIIFYKWYKSTKEGFEQGVNNTLEKHVDEIPIKPTLLIPSSGTIMSGSDFIAQREISPAWGQDQELDHGLEDGAGGSYDINNNMCSPSCCSEQWPTPHKLGYDQAICGNKTDYVPSPYTCQNSSQNSGCLCMTKKQNQFLSGRGGNA